MISERSFSRKEISTILSKASEFQRDKELFGSNEGLTSSELIQIAKETGIDEDSLQLAIEKMDEVSPELPSSFWSPLTSIQKVARFDGEINEQNWEKVVQEIRFLTGGIGKVSKVGSSFEWEQRKKELEYSHFTVTPENGKTSIQYVTNWNERSVLTTVFTIFFFVIISAIIGKTLDLKPYFGIIIPIAGLLGFTGSRILLKSYAMKQKAKVDLLMTNLSKKFKSLKEKSAPLLDLQDNSKNEEHDSSSTTHSTKQQIR